MKPLTAQATAPMAMGGADGWASDDLGLAVAVAVVVVAVWWVLSRIPVRGHRRIHRLIVWGRPVQPVAAIGVLVTGGLSTGVTLGATSEGRALGGAPGLGIAVVGMIACSVLCAGWWRGTGELVRAGLFLAAVTWGGAAGAALVDGRAFNAWVSACWALLFLVSWVVESTVRAHGGDRGQA